MTITLTDDYGRRVVFDGQKLVAETTDTEDSRKPQWVELDIWTTTAGSFVVQRAARYRLVHTSETCPRAEGYDLSEGTATHPCSVCNTTGSLTGWVQAPRITVDVHKTPEDLIESLRVDGRYTRFARAILADLSELDPRVEKLWNTVVVP
jgi:hypothetical protein